MQKLFTIDRIGNHGKLSVVRTDKGELLYEHEGSVFTEVGLAMETVNYSEGEQNFIKGIIRFAKRQHETIPPKLKKCPFCGNAASLMPGERDPKSHLVVCAECGCTMGLFDSKWDAVASWNIRVGKRRG